MTKVVSLSVHRNTREQRRRHEVSRDFVTDAKRLAREKGLDGYVMVAWNGSGDSLSAWSWSKTVPRERIQEFTRAAIAKQMTKFDAEEEE